jgi:hypothetical protein
MSKRFRSIVFLTALTGLSMWIDERADACVNIHSGSGMCNCNPSPYGGYACYTNGETCVLAGQCGDGPGRSPL